MRLKFFDLAKAVSKKSDHHKYKLGCVLVRKNRVLSFGFNSLKTHSKAKSRFKTLHAEQSAILDAPYNSLKGATAYVYRETKDGRPANAKPCPDCTEALKKAGIKVVYYTDSINNNYGIENYRN